MSVESARLIRAIFLSAGLSIMAISSALADENAWKDWNRLSGMMCPSHHVEWNLCSGCLLELTEGFEKDLPKPLHRRIIKVADYRPCVGEQLGFFCEVSVSLKAYQQTGLLPRFTAFACRKVKCEEPSICSDPSEDKK